MKTPLASQTQASIDIPEVVSVPSLMERARAYFEQERYAEGMTLLTLVAEDLPPDQLHLTPLLEVLQQEYIKYSHLQQTLQEVSAQLIEVHMA
jgi:hypothetical protein